MMHCNYAAIHHVQHCNATVGYVTLNIGYISNEASSVQTMQKICERGRVEL